MTFIESAVEVLKEQDKPMTAGQIWDKITEKKLMVSKGKTPVNTLYAVLSSYSNNSNFDESRLAKNSLVTIVSQNPYTFSLIGNEKKNDVEFDEFDDNENTLDKDGLVGKIKNLDVYLLLTIIHSDEGISYNDMNNFLIENGLEDCLIKYEANLKRNSNYSYSSSKIRFIYEDGIYYPDYNYTKNNKEILEKYIKKYFNKFKTNNEFVHKSMKIDNIMQIYEDYWSITLWYSNFNGNKFRKSLNIIVDYIDYLKQNNLEYNSSLYKDLQIKISDENKIPVFSSRKVINQCVKLGFINPFLESYHPMTKSFLSSDDDRSRKFHLSLILDTNSRFNASITNKSEQKEIKFLIETLKNIGKLSKDDRFAIMTVNTSNYPNGYINRDELNIIKEHVKEIKFSERKYNQQQFLCNILRKMGDLHFDGDDLYLNSDLLTSIPQRDNNRDAYSQKQYRDALRDQSKNIFGSEVCMLTKEYWSVTWASHIKEYSQCNDDEKYDVNNGLLFNKDFDELFDRSKKVSFDIDGNIIYSDDIHPTIVDRYKNYKLDDNIYNTDRKKYMEYHRQQFFEKNNSGFIIKNEKQIKMNH